MPFPRGIREALHDLDVQIREAGDRLHFVVGKTLHELNAAMDLRDVDFLFPGTDGKDKQNADDQRNALHLLQDRVGLVDDTVLDHAVDIGGILDVVDRI